MFVCVFVCVGVWVCECVSVCVYVRAIRKNLNIFVTIFSDISRLIVVPVNKLLSLRKFWFLLNINAAPTSFY